MHIHKKIIIALLFILLIPYLSFGFGGDQTLSEKSGTSIITEVRHYIGETSAAFFSDDRMIEWIDSGIKAIITQTRCLEFQDVIALTSSTTTYSVTSSYFGINHILLETSTYFKYLEPSSPKVVGFDGAEAGEPVYWWENAGKIWVYPIPTSGLTIYVSGVSKPSEFSTSGTSIPLPAMYDTMLIYYVTAQALYRKGEFNKANVFMTQFNYWAELYRQQYVDFKMKK